MLQTNCSIKDDRDGNTTLVVRHIIDFRHFAVRDVFGFLAGQIKQARPFSGWYPDSLAVSHKAVVWGASCGWPALTW